MRKIIIGVMGPGDRPTVTDTNNAWELGKLIAESGWVLLTGGRNVGVMDAASRGAKAANGLTIGILPDNNTKRLSSFVDIPIITGMGSARNTINVLSSDVVIACGLGSGTASEIALALNSHKPVILLNNNPDSLVFFRSISPDYLFSARTPQEAISIVQELLSKNKQ